MSAVILNDIPFDPAVEAIQHVLETKLGRRSESAFRELIEEAKPFARPKAMFKEAYIDEKGEDYVLFGEQRFQSRILRVNLGDAHRVFVYVVTCGRELEEWKANKEDTLEQYYADAVNGLGLEAAREYLYDYLMDTYQLKNIASMAPGSLEDWPIHEQRPLFDFLGDTEEAIGVCLLDSLLMDPGQTVSGIFFPTESTFESCQLCGRENCPHRKAPYDPDLYEEKFASS
jgi:hypothetical protein